MVGIFERVSADPHLERTQRKKSTFQNVREEGIAGQASKFMVSQDDILFAIPIHKATEAQFKAGRSMRKV